MGACARNMWSDSVEIKPAQCCIKLVFRLTSISTLMYTVWHVDKYKITFKLVINHWTNEIL